MVRIHHCTLSREQLEAIPETDRRLLVLSAHAANELHVLGKLLHFAAGSRHEIPMLMHADNAHALVLARLLAGKIHECWQLLQAAYFKSTLSRDYSRDIGAKAASALSDVKNYFGKSNAISTVRNKFGFHYAPDQIDGGFAALDDGDPLDIYLAKFNANSFYSFADTIAGRAMLEAIKPGDAQGALDTLIDDTNLMVDKLGEVIAALMDVCLERHLGGDWYSICDPKVIELQGAPNLHEVMIPFFIEIQPKSPEL